jgi:hypothetical protein
VLVKSDERVRLRPDAMETAGRVRLKPDTTETTGGAG